MLRYQSESQTGLVLPGRMQLHVLSSFDQSNEQEHRSGSLHSPSLEL